MAEPVRGDFEVIPSQLSFESGGVPITLDRFLPAAGGEAGPRFPTILGLHGSGGGHATMAEPATLLASHGFAVYVLHYFDRTGIASADMPTIFRHFPIWMKTLWDTISHIERQPEVDPTRIGLLGFSLGAYLALANAAIDPRIQVVVEFFGGLPKEMKLFMRRFCPVLILHGEADQTVPVAEAHHLQQVLEKKVLPYEIKIYPGAGHGFDGEAWEDACERMLAFFHKFLHPSSQREDS